MKLYGYTAEYSLPRIAVKGLPEGFAWWPHVNDAIYHAEVNPEERETRKGKWEEVPMVVMEIDTKKTGEIFDVPWEETGAYFDRIREQYGEKKAIKHQRGLERSRTAAQFLKLVDDVTNFRPIKPKHITVLGFPAEEWDWDDEPGRFKTPPKPVVAWKQPLITRLLRSIFVPKHKLYGVRMGQTEALPAQEVEAWAEPEDVMIEGVELVWAAGKKFPRGLRGAFGRETGDAMIAAIEDEVGERPGKLLGSGKRGAAYRLPSGRALKVTMDAREMKAAARVLGVIHPNLARVWQAFVVRANGKGVGIIVRDAVDHPLDPKEPLGDVLDGILDLEVENLKKAIEQDPGADEGKFYADGMRGATDELRQSGCDLGEPFLLDIADAYRELEYLGIVGLDFGAQNFGIVKKPKERVVLFDYGMAFVSGEQSVPVLAPVGLLEAPAVEAVA